MRRRRSRLFGGPRRDDGPTTEAAGDTGRDSSTADGDHDAGQTTGGDALDGEDYPEVTERLPDDADFLDVATAFPHQSASGLSATEAAPRGEAAWPHVVDDEPAPADGPAASGDEAAAGGTDAEAAPVAAADPTPRGHEMADQADVRPAGDDLDHPDDSDVDPVTEIPAISGSADIPEITEITDIGALTGIADLADVGDAPGAGPGDPAAQGDTIPTLTDVFQTPRSATPADLDPLVAAAATHGPGAAIGAVQAAAAVRGADTGVGRDSAETRAGRTIDAAGAVTAADGPPADLPSSLSDVDWGRLAQRLRADVTDRLLHRSDALLDAQLAQTLRPVVDRAIGILALELQDAMTRMVRDLVARAVAEELARVHEEIAAGAASPPPVPPTPTLPIGSLAATSPADPADRAASRAAADASRPSLPDST